MYKVVFAAVLVAGLIVAPLPVLTHSAVAQTAPDKKEAKPKREPPAGMIAMRERQKKCGAEWKEAKAAGKTNG
jgi:hypothetical protein